MGNTKNDEEKSGLFRQLNALDVFCIAAGAMISSGLFVLPGFLYAKIGPVVIVVYILAGLFVLPALFAKAELVTAMPKAGGSYFFVERSMGSLAGTIGGFASWLSLSLKSAFALVGTGVFALLINPDITEWHIKLIAVGLCLFFIILNVISVKSTGRFQIIFVLLLISLLSLYIFRGLFSLNVHRYTPFMPLGRHELFAAVGMVFISYGGLTKIASVAEEVKDPSRNIPFGMIWAFCVVILLYGLTVFVTVGLLDGDELAHSLTPLSTGGYKTFGFAGKFVMAFAAILAFASTANAGILSASRFPLAMSRDLLIPEFFSRINKRFNTPHFSIIGTGIFMIAVILLLDLENLVKVASAVMILLFMFVIIASIIMRESRILNYKPAFVSPLYPWIQIGGIICYGFFLFEMGNVTLLSIGVFLFGSILWHRLYVQRRAIRKSALIHIVERITAKEINGDTLASELREILQDRDRIVEDKFDKLVGNCEILDIGKQISSTEFFTIVSKKLAERLDIDSNELFDLFVNRENESTTVIRPGLAIPHIIIEGENQFELLIARCEAGIVFSDMSTPVYTVFILVGTRDERNFHLRALSAIAQITQDVNFDKDWLKAKSIEELRDIILLAKRRREK